MNFYTVLYFTYLYLFFFNFTTMICELLENLALNNNVSIKCWQKKKQSASLPLSVYFFFFCSVRVNRLTSFCLVLVNLLNMFKAAEKFRN